MISSFNRKTDERVSRKTAKSVNRKTIKSVSGKMAKSVGHNINHKRTKVNDGKVLAGSTCQLSQIFTGVLMTLYQISFPRTEHFSFALSKKFFMFLFTSPMTYIFNLKYWNSKLNEIYFIVMFLLEQSIYSSLDKLVALPV